MVSPAVNQLMPLLYISVRPEYSWWVQRGPFFRDRGRSDEFHISNKKP